jgi:hypothetical protein
LSTFPHRVGQPVRHRRLKGRPASRPDEERNLEEAGDLERGEPIPVFFETLEHRVSIQKWGLT